MASAAASGGEACAARTPATAVSFALSARGSARSELIRNAVSDGSFMARISERAASAPSSLHQSSAIHRG